MLEGVTGTHEPHENSTLGCLLDLQTQCGNLQVDKKGISLTFPAVVLLYLLLVIINPNTSWEGRLKDSHDTRTKDLS